MSQDVGAHAVRQLPPVRPVSLLVTGLVAGPAFGNGEVERADVTGDREAVTVQPDRDNYESPYRSGYVRVDLTCSDGHGFAFIMGNHKVAEFVGVVPRV